MVESDTPPPCTLVADDVLGGFFALNGGRFSSEGHTVWYFAPDALEWEDTDRGYTDFLTWCLSGDLELFYRPYRWPDWRAEVELLRGDQAFSIAPRLFTAGDPIGQRSRRPVPITELFGMYVGAV
jgi:hypothetical protein